MWYGILTIGVIGIAVVVWARTAPAPDGLGLRDGRLAPCPSSPNCVSSRDGEMPPIEYTGTRREAATRLTAVVQAMPRATVVTQADEYMHVAFRSAVFGFVDDCEFSFPKTEKVIHFRSASRCGHSDLGVNRDRMMRITRAFQD